MAAPTPRKGGPTVNRGGFKSPAGPPPGGMKRSHKIALGATGVILAGAWLGAPGNERIDSRPTDPGANAYIYSNLDECLKARRSLVPKLNSDGTFDPNAKSPEQLKCDADFKTATESHVSTAPKFGLQQSCESEYGAGQCQRANFNGATVFVPAMVGFMVANYLSNSARQPQALLPPRRTGAAPCPPGITPAQQPGCLMPRQTSSGSSSNTTWRSYSTSSGHTVSRDTSKPANTTSHVPSGAASAPAARTSLGAAPVHSLARSSSYSRSSSTTSRGGFGSTSRSYFRSSGS